MSTCCCFGCVEQTEVAVIENLGKYDRLASAGCLCLFCPFENVAGRLSLRVRQLHVSVDTKTKDNVFVNVVVCIQYQVIAEHAVDAFVSLRLPTADLCWLFSLLLEWIFECCCLQSLAHIVLIFDVHIFVLVLLLGSERSTS